MKRENEDHLFKWVDEALLEEIRMVEEKCKLVAQDVNALRMEVMGTMKVHNINFKKMEDAISNKIMKTVGLASVILCSIVWLWGRV
ncbi:uncharacterized protein At4g04775-like [Arabidopsis lyrata subsp. lyrata]|uniref:uncharacterized protein At4g04775-like n=1 Tax=Arabidopsis lyrata subsp. lyrata TaxID=81972 RepID=UPI000A29DC70|nr:uncharacterized protein At4g04775-like [Arabidopsis lyrata subsp. lyrata]|eukprot:XP_020872622.1 uncharacterized protein At4g04775-like [Arabidopsis lyrata subsp. lyrata]